MGALRTRVKICGIRDATAAAAASEGGADALGFVFYPPSPRNVTPEEAAQALAAAGPLVTSVGLFVNPSVDTVEAVLAHCPLDCLQFHGDESAEFCASFGRPYLKAIRMKPGLHVAEQVAAYPDARALLFDAWRADTPGGTGETFPWELIPEVPRPWLLAGGLTVANVGEAIRIAAPPAVDVSGGVEARRGEKDVKLIEGFLAAVREADHQRNANAAQANQT